MSKWTQPICERCWINRNLSMNSDGTFNLANAVRLTEPTVEQCAFCASVTIFGAYIRADPITVPFPSQKSDE